jgi:hypothetical protein
MINPITSNLHKVTSGQTIRAEHYNLLVDALKKFTISGVNVFATGNGYLIREPPQSVAATKWVIVRPPVTSGSLVITAEDAMRHPEYGEAGDNQGRWIGVSEADPENPQPPIVNEYPIWPHLLADFYTEFAQDGETVVRETQVLLATYVGDAWFVDPRPPFLTRRLPHTAIKTPCSVPEETP